MTPLWTGAMSSGELPRMTPGAARRVSTPDTARAVLATFHNPHWTAPLRAAPGLLRHRRHDCELHVRSDGVVCFVAFHPGGGARRRPAPVVAPARRRRRGGAGMIWPTTWPNSVPGCGRAGTHCPTVANTGALTCRTGAPTRSPATASDHRALRNATHDLAALGIDLRRLTRGRGHNRRAR